MIPPPVILAMRSRNASANASRRPLAGPRQWPACARCGIADCSRSIGNLLWRSPPTPSFDCANCSPRLSDDPPEKSKGCRCSADPHSTYRKTRLPPQCHSSRKPDRPKIQDFFSTLLDPELDFYPTQWYPAYSAASVDRLRPAILTVFAKLPANQ